MESPLGESLSQPVDVDSQASGATTDVDHSIGPLSAININAIHDPSSPCSQSMINTRPQDGMCFDSFGQQMPDLAQHGHFDIDETMDTLQITPNHYTSHSHNLERASQAWSGDHSNDFSFVSPRLPYAVPESSIGEETAPSEYEPSLVYNSVGNKDDIDIYLNNFETRPHDGGPAHAMEDSEQHTMTDFDDDLAGLTEQLYPEANAFIQNGRPIPRNELRRSSAIYAAKDKSFMGGIINHTSLHAPQVGLPASCPTGTGLFLSSVSRRDEQQATLPIDAKKMHNRLRSTSVTSNPRQGPLPPLPEVGGPFLQETWSRIHIEEMSEESRELARSASGKSRGKRRGPMDPKTKAAAGERRKTKLTCINCKSGKTQCDQGSPCGTCRKSRRHSNACVKAEWVQIVKDGECASRFHRSYCVLSSTRTYIGISEIDHPTHLPRMLQILSLVKESYNLTVLDMSSKQYTIHLSKLYPLLVPLTKAIPNGHFTPRDLFDMVKPEDILGTVEDESSLDEAERLTHWGRMPCQSILYLKPVRGGDLVSVYLYPQETIEVYVALNRLMLRALEIQSHTTLQEVVNKLIQTGGSTDIERVTHISHQLEEYSCTLRLRHAWYRQHEPPSSADDPAFASHQRLKEVLRSLYFWVFKAWEKLEKLEKLEKNYKDAAHVVRRTSSTFNVHGRPVDDPLPEVENEAGFEAWLEQGSEVLFAAGLAQQNFALQQQQAQIMVPGLDSMEMEMEWSNEVFCT